MVYGSIYNTNNGSVSESTFDPRYAMPDGPSLVVQEALETDQKFFDLFIEHDFVECGVNNGVVSESTLEAIDENFATDVWEKIKQLLQKIKDKIVSIVKSAMVKLHAIFIKDNKALVEKYSKQYSNADKSKVEIKGWRDYDENAVKKYDLKDIFERACNNFTSDQDHKDQYKEDYSINELLSKTLNGKSTNASSYQGDYINEVFATARTAKGDDIGNITTYLNDYESTVKSIKENQKKDEDAIAADQKLVDNFKKLSDDKTSSETTRKQYSDKYSDAKTACTNMNILVGKWYGAKLAALKKNMQQCRSAYIKIAAYGAKTESTLVDAEIEAAEYELESSFDQYSYDYEDLIA
jgi:hypothetical protein